MLREKLIRIAYTHPEIRPDLLPLLRLATSPAQRAADFHAWQEDVTARGRNWQVALLEASKWDDEERARIEEHVGLALLGAGSERAVFDQGRTVLKIIFGGRARTDANQTEVALWKFSSDYPQLRALLVPIIAHDAGGDWLVMEKARPSSSAGVLPPDLPVRLYDVKPQNWGVHEGSLKLLDYSMWSPA